MRQVHAWRYVVLAAAGMVAFLSLLVAQAPRSVRKLALLVGVNCYDRRGFSDLSYAERDATELADTLQKAGFRVLLLTGSAAEDDPLRATRANIDTQLKRLLVGAKKDDVVLVALCGHGHQLSVTRDSQEKEDAFYCPVDAVLNDPGSLFSLSYLIDEVLGVWGGQNVVLVDACRDAPKDPGRSSRSIRGVQGRTMSLPENTAVLFSCRAGQQSFENDQLKHGLFTSCVLEALRGKALKEGVITWSSLVNHVEERMAAEELRKMLPEGRQQQPIGSTNLGRVVLARLDSEPDRSEPSPSKSKPVEEAQVREESKPEKIEPVVKSPPPPKTDIRVERGRELNLELPGKVKLKLVRIPAGGKSFWMGSPAGEENRRDDEEQHKVEFTKDYWMAVTETTKAQYRAVMSENASAADDDDFPVDHVSWEVAQVYCTRLKVLIREQNLVFRLPTEAEWEYAARGGSAGKESLPFHLAEGPTGWLTANQANFDGSQPVPFLLAPRGTFLRRTTHVASYPANRFGLHDMHGNIAEWCQDWYGPYSCLATGKDPVQNERQGYSLRVLRGGYWIHAGADCRAARRDNLGPAWGGDSTGFRVACNATLAMP